MPHKVYDSRVALQKQGALAQRQVDDQKVAIAARPKSAYANAKQHLETLNSVGQREQIHAAQAMSTRPKRTLRIPQFRLAMEKS